MRITGRTHENNWLFGSIVTGKKNTGWTGRKMGGRAWWGAGQDG